MFRVGMQTRAWEDASRLNWAGTARRPLLTHVWYPAVDSAEESDVLLGAPRKPLFVAGRAAVDAEVHEEAHGLPCVLLSHGTGGAGLQLGWLASALAARGHVVAAVNHHGNTSGEPYAPQGFVLWWERSRDLSAVLDHLLADPVLGSRVDAGRVGAAGFSLGGYTVLSVLGARTSLEAFESFCAGPEADSTCLDQAEFPGIRELFARLEREDPGVKQSLAEHGDSFRDPRVRAGFAMAPALGGAFTDAGLATVESPVSIVVGEGDKVAPVFTNARRFADGIVDASLTILPGPADHYAFLAEPTALGRETLPIFCVDHADVDRAAVHRTTSRLAIDFFDKHLHRV